MERKGRVSLERGFSIGIRQCDQLFFEIDRVGAVLFGPCGPKAPAHRP